jgi:hypothetical protein
MVAGKALDISCYGFRYGLASIARSSFPLLLDRFFGRPGSDPTPHNVTSYWCWLGSDPVLARTAESRGNEDGEVVEGSDR